MIHTIDQLALPGTFRILKIEHYRAAIDAIKTMKIRGAPAIGAMGAYGFALALQGLEQVDMGLIDQIQEEITSARPTAYDLTDGILFVRKNIEGITNLSDVTRISLEAAEEYADRSVKACRAIGLHGKDLIREGANILTHCNAGALATVDYGTALSPMRLAHEENRKFFVFVDETRPRLQGAMLTAWELGNEGIDHAVITDNAAGYYFQQGRIDLVITGTDRVARNGDIANKIGTYEKALLAKHHGVQFYIAAPFSTIDFNCESGMDIPIEERNESEVLTLMGQRIAPEKSRAFNPAFDITPADLITGIITEHGIIKPGDLASWEPDNG